MKKMQLDNQEVDETQRSYYSFTKFLKDSLFQKKYRVKYELLEK